MSLSAHDIEDQVFKERFRGYDPDEVDRFLDRVAARLAELERERDEAAALAQDSADRQGETSETEHLLRRTLLSAERTAEQTVADAREEAEQLREDARLEATELRETARREVEELRSDAQAEARAELEAARAGAERVRAALAELREFRDDYRDRVSAVITEQLVALDRVELPDIPPQVERLADVGVDPASSASE